MGDYRITIDVRARSLPSAVSWILYDQDGEEVNDVVRLTVEPREEA